VPTISATRAKSEFGRLVDEVEGKGAIAIERYHKDRAVLLSVEEFEALVREREAPSRVLEARLDELFARLAEPDSAATMDRAFRAETEDLGEAAVRAARR
jgi:PHD/YefM family antitoxin component YafN of YafNO toxin-antitoxin module